MESVTASDEPFQSHQMPRQAFGDRFAESYRGDRVFISGQDKYRAANTLEVGAKIHAPMLVARSVEPHRHRVVDESAFLRVLIHDGARAIERKAHLEVFQPALHRGIEPVAFGDRARMRATEALERSEHRGKVDARRGARQNQFRRMIRVAGGVGLRDKSPERAAVDNRPLDPEYVAKPLNVVAPLSEVPGRRVATLAAPVAAMVEIDDLDDIRQHGECRFVHRVVKTRSPVQENEFILGPSGIRPEPSTSK